MSETVLLIGAAHAIPVLIVGLVSRSETVMTITAAIMALIGMATGSPSYMAVDIGGVVLGIFLFYAFDMPREKTLHISPQNEKQSNFDMERFVTLNNYRNEWKPRIKECVILREKKKKSASPCLIFLERFMPYGGHREFKIYQSGTIEFEWVDISFEKLEINEDIIITCESLKEELLSLLKSPEIENQKSCVDNDTHDGYQSDMTIVTPSEQLIIKNHNCPNDLRLSISYKKLVFLLSEIANAFKPLAKEKPKEKEEKTYDTPSLYDKNGFTREGIHRGTGSKYSPKGYDKDGYDEDGYFFKEYILPKNSSTISTIQTKDGKKGYYVLRLITDESLLKEIENYQKQTLTNNPNLAKNEVRKKVEEEYKNIVWNNDSKKWNMLIERIPSIISEVEENDIVSPSSHKPDDTLYKTIKKRIPSSISEVGENDIIFSSRHKPYDILYKTKKKKKRKKEKPSSIFCKPANFSYYNHCWRCKNIVTDNDCRCPSCGWFICSECGACGCDFG
jgi:hypothetical protein